MNKQQVKGRYEEAKGKVKEVAGHVTGNEELEVEGKLQKDAGKIQAGVGDLAEKIKQGG
ncbi:MAG: CsbD family protein [Chromatiaceae bacterium]